MGCIGADMKPDGRRICAFCRTPLHTSSGEYIKRIKKRVEADNAEATYLLGFFYRQGENGLQQDHGKALDLWRRAAELGSAAAYNNIGYAYENGMVVESDDKKALYYYELAAMGGDVYARHNLGGSEYSAGNMSRAVKHWMISAGAGNDKSLAAIRECYLRGHATKDDFEKALRAHKESKDEMKSDKREEVAAQIAARRAARTPS